MLREVGCRQSSQAVPLSWRRVEVSMARFFFWTSWVASTERPGSAVTYTSNWPHEPLIANKPTSGAVMAGLDAAFVDGIRCATNERDQVMVDLDALNGVDALADGRSRGTVPSLLHACARPRAAGRRSAGDALLRGSSARP